MRVLVDGGGSCESRSGSELEKRLKDGNEYRGMHELRSNESLTGSFLRCPWVAWGHVTKCQ